MNKNDILNNINNNISHINATDLSNKIINNAANGHIKHTDIAYGEMVPHLVDYM